MRPNDQREIEAWVEKSIRPKSPIILGALANDLKVAISAIDKSQLPRLWDIIAFLIAFAPGTSWGSPESMILWASNDPDCERVRQNLDRNPSWNRRPQS